MTYTNSDRMKYVGCLSLLASCSHHVSPEMRDQIERALKDGCEDGRLRYGKSGTGFYIEVLTGGQL